MIPTIKYPKQEEWASLCNRAKSPEENIRTQVEEIILTVKRNGDKALIDYALRFDQVKMETIQVSQAEFDEAAALVSEDLKKAMQQAAGNIRAFHSTQIYVEPKVETMPGVTCWRKSVPIEKVGLYIPGGSAPLFSTVLMLAIPATIAGCSEIIICTPPGKDNKIHPAILYAASLAGVQKVFKVGGAQAIAAMAYGTESIPGVYKILGPGNQYVTEAKMHLCGKGIAIDMPAGPSEVAIIADVTGNPEFIAADLLAQAEHGPDSQVVLIATDEQLINETGAYLTKQISVLPRKDIASKALQNSRAILLHTIEECIEFSNVYAPEHLIIMCDDNLSAAAKVKNAGSVFLGQYSPESVGDYASGTNHTLPTNGFASAYSGVSVDSFIKKITFQELTIEGLHGISNTVAIMAKAEGLDAHAHAVTIRLNTTK